MYSSFGSHGGHYRPSGNNCPPFPGSFLSAPQRPFMDQRLLRANSPSFGYSHYGTEPSAKHVKCGELRPSNVGETVEIAGRVSKMRSCRFLLIRDETGVTQLVAPDERADLQKRMAKMPLDSYVVIRGEVISRPESARNKNMPTGSVEVFIHEFITVQAKRKQADADDDDLTLGRTKIKQKRGSERLTTEELAKAENKAMRSYFAARSHTCGDVNPSLVSQELSLCGWVHIKRTPRFIVLKDGHGELQLVCANNVGGLGVQLQNLHVGSVIFVRGLLARRPVGQGNPRSLNGNYELSVTELTTVTPQSPIVEGMDIPSKDEMEVGLSPLPPLPASDRLAIQVPSISKYCERTHTCGELRSSHVGETVTLMGWVEFIRMNKFFTIRDSYGTTQIVISDSNVEQSEVLSKLDFESVVAVTGTVCDRPPHQIKMEQPTGEIEILASSLEVLNRAGVLPFNIRDFQKANETLRMQHRYLDLRFQKMQKNLRMRSAAIMKMREFLINRLGFVEVETPTLFARTPGGAREFVVPTHTPNQFYSLVQSPQQLKQLLMVGAMDRYFQIARCYRDENTRPDRQLEFTQLDIELSFCRSSDVMQLVEDLLRYSWPDPSKVATPFPRMTYKEAMEKYGSDKPDLRYNWQIVHLTDAFKFGRKENTKVDIGEIAKSEDFAACAMVAQRGAMSNSVRKKSVLQLKTSYPLATPLIFSVKDLSSLEKSLVSLLGESIAAQTIEKTAVSENDTLVIVFGPRTQVLQSLGKLRTDMADSMEAEGLTVRQQNELKFLWVTDFPLFTSNDEGKLESSHHPFTAPIPEHKEDLFVHPTSVTGQHYDLVLNGSEVAGGSIRIHDGDLQEKVLKNILDIPVEPLGHLIAALRCGAPPHGGIALGIDRLVAIMAGESSIRDVIAFPKNSEGKDPLTGAPSMLDEDDLTYYNLTVKNED